MTAYMSWYETVVKRAEKNFSMHIYRDKRTMYPVLINLSGFHPEDFIDSDEIEFELTYDDIRQILEL